MKNKIIVITQISLMVITTTIAILIINDLNNQIELSQKAERRAVNEYDILLNQYKITENLLTNNKRLYQHFIASYFQTYKNDADSTIVEFLKYSECIYPEINFCTAKHETGNGKAGSGKATFISDGKKYKSYGQHGMKSARKFFTWNNGISIRNKQAYDHWTYSYLTMDERIQRMDSIGVDLTWQNDWYIYEKSYKKLGKKIRLPLTRKGKLNKLIGN